MWLFPCKPKLDELAERISKDGGQFTGYALDVNDALAVERFVEEVIEKFGRLDVLVNNAR